MHSKVTQIHYISSMAEEIKKEETKAAEVKEPTLMEKLNAITVKNRADLKARQTKNAEEQNKLMEIGRSKDAARRVSSATRISGLRGLEPRLGMQFAKKTND